MLTPTKPTKPRTGVPSGHWYIVPKKTGVRVVQKKTGVGVVPKKTGVGVVPEKTGVGVVPKKTGGSVVPKKTGGSVVPKKTGVGVVPKKTGGSVVPKKTGVKVDWRYSGNSRQDYVSRWDNVDDHVTQFAHSTVRIIATKTSKSQKVHSKRSFNIFHTGIKQECMG